MTSAPKNSDPAPEGHAFETARVWDIPTRVFHWALVATVTAGWLIGENMTFTNIEWHFYLGYATGGLVVFRLFWGLVGPKPAKLSALVPSPKSAINYLKNITKRTPSGVHGHNPLGALSILALLGSLAVMVTTGLFSESEDLFAKAPLAHLVDKSMIQTANAVHEIFAKVLLALVGLHVAALLYYLLWKRENLIRAMVTGMKLVRRLPR